MSEAYKTSKDYERLWELLTSGTMVLCKYDGVDWFMTGLTGLVHDVFIHHAQRFSTEFIDPASQQVTGEASDGYHTFNELYRHRAILFAALCRCYPEFAWKSRKHHDGTMYDGMFICGIHTENGDATYHYDIDPYWEIFECGELESAPEWDGHTPEIALERLGQLYPSQVPAGAIASPRKVWHSPDETPEADGEILIITHNGYRFFHTHLYRPYEIKKWAYVRDLEELG